MHRSSNNAEHPVLELYYRFTDAQQATAYAEAELPDDLSKQTLIPQPDGAFYLPNVRYPAHMPPRLELDDSPSKLLVPTGHTRTPDQLNYELPHPSWPNGAENTLRLLTGPNQFYDHTVPPVEHHPAWWSILNLIDRDCYVVWELADGTTGIVGTTCFARTIRGVIYARWVTLGDHCEPNGYAYRATCIELNLTEEAAGRHTHAHLQLQIKLHPLTGVGTTLRECRPSIAALPDESWQYLMRRARVGFKRHCSHNLPPDTESIRRQFVEQVAKADGEANRLAARAFREQVRQLDYLAALDLVAEPWQLEVVVQEHAAEPQFHVNSERMGTLVDRRHNLLEAYCQERPDDLKRSTFYNWVATYLNLREFPESEDDS